MATEVASIFAKVSADLTGFKRGMAVFERGVRRSGGMFRDFTMGINQGIGQAFGNMAINAIGGLGDAITDSVKSAANMEQGIADIRAIMGLTAEQTEELQGLISSLAIDPNLRVSAQEAAATIEMLGRNGVSFADIMAGAARATVLLANATGADFATAADVATDVMQQFGIEAKDMMGAVDQIAGVTRNSKFDINDYRLAIGQAGAVAASVGVSFEDFNAVMAATAHAFTGGSDWGTSFKTFLQRLVPETAAAAEKMRELGLYSGLTGDEFAAAAEKVADIREQISNLDPTSESYQQRLQDLKQELAAVRATMVEGSNAFFDANGNMKSMAEISDALREAFAGLNDEQKISAARTMFGNDAWRMAFALADLGVGVIGEYKKAIGDTSAEEMAATRTDTLAAKWENFNDIIAEYVRQIGAKFIATLKETVIQLTIIANEYGPRVVEWAGTMAARFDTVAKAVLDLIRIGLDNGWKSLFTPLEDGTRALDKLFEAFGMTKEQAQETSERLIAFARDVVNLGSKIIDLVGQLAKGAAATISWIDEFVGIENAIKAVMAIMAGGFAASIVGAVASIVSAVGTIAGFVASLTGLGSVAASVGAAVVAAITAMTGPIALVLAAITGLSVAWSQNWFDIQGKTETAWNMIRHFVGSGVRAIRDYFNVDWRGIGHNMVASIVDGIRGAWNWLTDTARDMANAAKTTAEQTLQIRSPSRVFRAMGQNVTKSFAMGIEEVADVPRLAIDRTLTQSVEIAPMGMGAQPARRSEEVHIYLHASDVLPANQKVIDQLLIALQRSITRSGARVSYS